MSWIDENAERYTATEKTDVAQEIYDKGLIWAINHAVLHREGYAIGLTTEGGKIIDIFLVKVPDEDGDGEIIFDAATGVAGYKKYLTAQHGKAIKNSHA